MRAVWDTRVQVFVVTAVVDFQPYHSITALSIFSTLYLSLQKSLSVILNSKESDGIITPTVHTGYWWGNLRGKKSLGRPRRRCEDNIKVDLQEVGWGTWTGLIWLRIGTGGGLLFKYGNEPLGSIKYG